MGATLGGTARSLRDPEVRSYAQRFANGDLSLADVRAWLDARPGPIEDSLEATIHACSWEIDAGTSTEAEARHWTGEQLLAHDTLVNAA